MPTDPTTPRDITEAELRREHAILEREQERLHERSIKILRRQLEICAELLRRKEMAG